MRAAIDPPVIFGDPSRSGKSSAAIGRCADEDVTNLIVEHAAPADVDSLRVSEGDRRTTTGTHIQCDTYAFFERLASIGRSGDIECGRTGLALTTVTPIQPRCVK